MRFTKLAAHHKLTMFGLNNVSHMPYICSLHVPDTTKSSVSKGHPMRSKQAMNGSDVFVSRPAITGSTKKGPNLKEDIQTKINEKL